MVKRNPEAQSLDEDEFTESFEQRVRRPPKGMPVQSKIKGEPAWKRRNREPKHRRVMLRVSESQLALLQAAAEHQEKSQQKILEEIVWPVLEEQYGVTEKDAPS